MERLFISGHRGLLGSACVRQLKHKYEILTMERNLMDDNWVRYWFAENQPDYVIHCAAKVGGVKANKEQPVSFLLDNLTIQNVVIQAAADYGVKRLVNIGTSCLYPRDCPVPVKESSLLTGPFEPSVEAYAIAKLAGLALCRAYNAERQKSFITVCPSNLYGLGDNYGPSAHVIPALIKRIHDAKAKGDTSIEVWGDGSATREFLSADDCARAIGKVLEADSPPDLINIGTGQSTTIRSLISMIQLSMDARLDVIWDTSSPTGIPHKTFDISTITRLGWQPQVPLASGLTQTIHDFMNNRHIRLK
jgi:GDP-L-fucose synthase